MLLNPEAWCQVAENLDKTELCALIKMLTITEKELPNCNFKYRFIGNLIYPNYRFTT
jgi:hypothetical protein